MEDPRGGQTRNELVSFDMPALPHTSCSAGRFSGQVTMPAQLMSNKEALNLLMNAGTCSGVGVAVWPSRGGAILYAGETQGKQISGVGLIEFPSARSTWSMASGKFENGAFSFGRASAGDVFDFVDRPWQAFIRANIQKKTSWTASIFKGQWRNGYPSQGITILPDGSMHVGSWKDGKFHDSCLFVDSEGSWIKGIFNKGRLINVTFRSFMKCKIPEVYSHLLTSAELANIPADVLQGEYKSFIDIADKLSIQGVEMSKLAKSISNIAFLKSEQVLGLPTHAVESSLNSLLHLMTKSPSLHNVSAASLTTKHEEVAPKAPPASGSNTNAFAGGDEGGGSLANPQAAALLQQLLQMQQSQGGSSTQQQAVDQQQKSGYRKILPALAATMALPTPTALPTPINVLQSNNAKQAVAGVASNESNVLSTAKMMLKRNEEGQKTIKEETQQRKTPGDFKVGILAVQPQIVSTGEEREITIDGFCTGEEGLSDISVLCISGNKFVKCKTALKKLSEGSTTHTVKSGMTNFEFTLPLTPDAVGITYFLFASNKSQLPYPIEKTLGPCKATLTMSEKTSEYHVAPLVVFDSADICQEIKHRLFLVSNHSRLDRQTRYQKVAEFLQHFGTFVGAMDQMSDKDKGFKESSMMQTIYISLLQHASKLCLPITFEYLESKQSLFRLDGQDTRDILNTHLFELIHKYLRAPSSALLGILDCCINLFKIPVDAILDRAGMKTSALHLIAASENGLKLLKMLSKSPQRSTDWFSLKDGLGASPLKCAKQKQLRDNADYLEEIRSHLEREKARDEEVKEAEGKEPAGVSDTTTISQRSKGSKDDDDENKEGAASTAKDVAKSNGEMQGDAEEMELDKSPRKGGDIVRIKVIQDHQERASRSIKRKLSEADDQVEQEEKKMKQ